MKNSISYGYVYATRNIITNKFYVGKCQFSQLRASYFGSGLIITRAIKKYGIKNFIVHKIIDAYSRVELNFLEKYYIAQYRKRYGIGLVYNICNGGEGFNGRHTIESRIKIGKAWSGKYRSIETRRKISASKKLWWSQMSNEFKKEMGLKVGAAGKGRIPYNKGKQASKITRARLRAAWKRRKLNRRIL